MKFYRVVTERRDFGEACIVKSRFGCARILARPASSKPWFDRGKIRYDRGGLRYKIFADILAQRSVQSYDATAIEAWQDPSRLDSDRILSVLIKSKWNHR